MGGEMERVIEIAGKHGLVLRQETMQLDESGLDFRVVFSRDESGIEWVLRLPRRADVMPRAKAEKKALDLVDQYGISFQVPRWAIYTDELIAYKKLDGVPAGKIDHTIGNYRWEIDVDHVPEAYHKTLAGVLAELHSIPAEKAAAHGLKVQTPYDARTGMRQRMDAVKEKFGAGEQLWKRWQKWIDDDDLWPKKTGLIHGDVHAGHTLIDKDAHVTGLIDWTEAKVADIANDFVFSFKAFGEEGLDDLIRHYKGAGGYYWPGMKNHIIELVAAYPVAVAEFALVSGMEEYVRMAKEALEVN